jgi:hypothetical protein
MILSVLNLLLCSDAVVSHHLISQYIGVLISASYQLNWLCWFVFIQVCTAKMNLSDEVDMEDYVSRPDKISAAEVSRSCNLLLATCFVLKSLHFMSYSFCMFYFT